MARALSRLVGGGRLTLRSEVPAEESGLQGHVDSFPESEDMFITPVHCSSLYSENSLWGAPPPNIVLGRDIKW